MLRTLGVWPVHVEELPPRRVHALVRVGAEVVALGLQEVGGEPGRSVTVEVGQRAAEGGYRDPVPHRECHDAAPGFLARGERKIDLWYASLSVIEVAFDDEADAFANINTRAELAEHDRR